MRQGRRSEARAPLGNLHAPRTEPSPPVFASRPPRCVRLLRAMRESLLRAAFPQVVSLHSRTRQVAAWVRRDVSLSLMPVPSWPDGPRPLRRASRRCSALYRKEQQCSFCFIFSEPEQDENFAGQTRSVPPGNAARPRERDSSLSKTRSGEIASTSWLSWPSMSNLRWVGRSAGPARRALGDGDPAGD